MHPRKVTDYDRRIGAKITALRKAQGLSQTQLGAALGVTFQQIQKYEKGQNRIAANRLRDIASALGMQPHDLFCEIYGRQENGEPQPFLSPEALQAACAFDAIQSRSMRRSLLELLLTAGAPQTAEAA
jgi:transcriptional regulator with XRE-family HTH domain